MVHDSVNSVPMWSIRTIDENIDVYRMYGFADSLCGMFSPQHGRAYVNVTFSYVDVCDIDEFSIHELNDFVQKLGYSAKVKLYYHFRKPDGDLDTGMHALGNDHDVRKLVEYVRLGNKMIKVYIEHERTTLHTYYTTHEDVDFSTPKCVIQEIEDDAMPEMQVTKLKPRKPVKGQSAKKLMLEWNGEPNVVDQGQASQVTKEIDNDFDPFLDLDSLDDADRDIPQTKTNNVTDAAEGSNREEGSDKEEGSDSDNSDGNDSDELVDNENPVEHVHVDMDTFDKNNADKLGVKDRQGKLNAHEDIDVDLDVIDNEEFESASDEDGLERFTQRKLKQLRKQNKPKHGNVHKYYFYVGQEFVSGDKVKDRVHRHPIETKRYLFLKKNDKQRVRSKGRGKIHVFEPTSNDGLSQGAGPSQVTRPNKEPGSSQKKSGLREKLVLLRELIIVQIVPIKAIQDQLQKKYQVEVSRMKTFRAKSKVVDQVRGDYTSQYHILRSYVMELKASNPNTTVRIGVESEADHTCPTKVFKRIYIYLGTAKVGFKACMRDFLGFDGAFMKGSFPESELKDSWTWFLEHLKEDLELQDNSNFTFISDKQKVLNGPLLDGRDRPIISALEYTREYMMKRIVVVKKAIAKCVGPLTPTATRLFEAIKNEVSEYNCDFNGGHLYVVSGPWQDQRVVDILHRICTCRKWELTGMPYWKAYKKKKSVGEDIPMVKYGKLSRRLKTVTCVLCHSKGHNKRSCKGPTSGQATKTKTVQGGSNKKRPADGSSERNVAAKKAKTVIPTQASQTTQASTTSTMRKNKGKAIAESSQKSGMLVRRSQRNVLKLG
ncbi:hypothetical protein Tco_0932606 [Tanacetum coccineum]